MCSDRMFKFKNRIIDLPHLFSSAGTRSSDIRFQTFLLEGLVRWNRDRVARALSTSDGEQHSYSSLLHHAANKLSKAVTGEHLITSFQEPRKYTGRYITNYKEF